MISDFTRQNINSNTKTYKNFDQDFNVYRFGFSKIHIYLQGKQKQLLFLI